jgi:ABC-type transport system involved in cytochrome c biogenesis ATPase subunit/GNAT superfamily N-acetyltransferase
MSAETLSVTVEADDILAQACEPFDYSFTGTSTFTLPRFSAPPRDGSWAIGLIVGPSGSGKTQLLRQHYGLSEHPQWNESKAVVSHFNTAKEATDKFAAVGLNSVPSWCRPFHVLSNGEQFRANMARMLESNAGFDEFTSVVDRTVAKSCSHAIQRHIRASGLTGLVFATCHYDVLEWIQPDWCFDTLTGAMLPRGCLQCRPPINLTIEPCARSWWNIFKHHHYMTAQVNATAEMYLATWDGKPVAFAACIAMPSGTLKNAWRGHRTVVLPDYQGLGIGVRLSDWMGARCLHLGRRYFSKTAHPRMGTYRDNSPLWKPTNKNHKARSDIKSSKNKNYNEMNRTLRANKWCYSHEYIGGAKQ